MHLENLKESIIKLLELINEFSKVAVYQVKNLFTVLCISNEHVETEVYQLKNSSCKSADESN